MNRHLRALSFAILVFAGSAGATPLLNPSFEDTESDGSAANWIDKDNLFGSPRCTIALCGSGLGTAGPRTGDAWMWFGGSTSGQAAFARQTNVTIPTNIGSIEFYLWIGLADEIATLTFLIDGIQLAVITEADLPTYSSYRLVSIPIAAFADGADHIIHFGYQDGPAGDVNFNVDDVALIAVPEPAALGVAGAGLVVLGTFLHRRRRGLTS